MSKDKKPKNYEVGYGKPPKEHQFKPGQAANPRGRRRKNPRVEIPSQIGKDFREVGRMKVTVRTPSGPRSLTAAQAVIWAVYRGAIEGKVSQQRLILQWLFQAYQENVQRRPVLENADKLNLETGEIEPESEFEQWLLGLSALSKKT